MSGVEIRVRSNSTQARSDITKLEKSIGKIQNTTKRVERSIAAIGSAIAFAFGTDAITKAADSFINLENRIALVTGRTKQLNKSLNDLYSVSIATRSGIDGSVETFNRFGRVLKDVTADELLEVTKTVQQAVAISGASSESAKAALVQLGQGLASGQLRGQELNSVLEQTPRIARAIADSLEVPVGSLRKLAEEGQLTSDVVFGALRGQAASINTEFGITNATISQGLTNLLDQFTRLIGVFDKFTISLSTLGFFFSACKDSNETVISIKNIRTKNFHLISL